MMDGGDLALLNGLTSPKQYRSSGVIINPVSPPIWAFMTYGYLRCGSRRLIWREMLASRVSVIGIIGLLVDGCLKGPLMKF
jgi:hypothetical protein